MKYSLTYKVIAIEDGEKVTVQAETISASQIENINYFLRGLKTLLEENMSFEYEIKEGRTIEKRTVNYGD